MQNRDAFKIAFVETDQTDMAYVRRDPRDDRTSHIGIWTAVLVAVTILAIVALVAMGAI
jgi:hypothetical protein